MVFSRIILLMIVLFSGLLSGCEPSSYHGCAAEYRLNGNLNDYIKAKVAKNAGELKFVKTPSGRGLAVETGKYPGYFIIEDMELSPAGFGISIWVKWSRFTDGQSLFTFRNPSDNSTFRCYLSRRKCYGLLNNRQVFNTKELAADTVHFHHIFIGGKNDQVDLYFDGKKSYSGTFSGITGTGDLITGADETGGHLLEGVVDEVRIYDEYITDDKVLSLYKSYQKKGM